MKKYSSPALRLTPLLLAIFFLSTGDAIGGDGSFSIGYKGSGGNTETADLTLKANIQRERETNRIFLNGVSYYGENDGVKNREESEVNLRLELRRGRLFPFWDNNYYHNLFTNYDYRIATGPGIGYYFIKTDRSYLTASYYFHYNRDKLIKEEDGEKEFTLYMNNLEERVKYKFNNKLKLKHKGIYRVSSLSSDDYYLFGEFKIVNDLTSRLALELVYTQNYQNLPKAEGVKKLDTTTSTFISFKF